MHHHADVPFRRPDGTTCIVTYADDRTLVPIRRNDELVNLQAWELYAGDVRADGWTVIRTEELTHDAT